MDPNLPSILSILLMAELAEFLKLSLNYFNNLARFYSYNVTLGLMGDKS